MAKARTRAQKRNAKRGRPLLPATDREPNGRASRRSASVVMQSRATASVVREARCRVHGMPEDIAERPEAGYVLGRLYLSGHLGRRAAKGKDKGAAEHRLDAGNRMAEAFSRYYGLVGIPAPTPRAQNLFRVRGETGDTDPAAARAASNAVMQIERSLGMADESGRPVTLITKRVCIQDEDAGLAHPHTFSLLVRGLDALVVHFSNEA